MYYVYVLRCNNGDLYIGYSDDLRKRVRVHQLGKARSTKSKRPIELVYYEAYKNKKDATKRERQLKNHRAKLDLKKQIRYSLEN